MFCVSGRAASSTNAIGTLVSSCLLLRPAMATTPCQFHAIEHGRQRTSEFLAHGQRVVQERARGEGGRLALELAEVGVHGNQCPAVLLRDRDEQSSQSEHCTWVFFQDPFVRLANRPATNFGILGLLRPELTIS